MSSPRRCCTLSLLFCFACFPLSCSFFLTLYDARTPTGQSGCPDARERVFRRTIGEQPRPVSVIFLFFYLFIPRHLVACAHKKALTHTFCCSADVLCTLISSSHCFPRLLAFWHVNPRVLNERLVQFLEDLVENAMEHTLHEMNNLQIIYTAAVGES